MASAKFYGTGRRKKSIARVYLVPGTGKITINKRDIDEYFGLETLKVIVRQPLALTETEGKFDVIVNVHGGGYTGQAGAIRHGLSRALLEADKDYRPALKAAGFLTRDPRMKERKKELIIPNGSFQLREKDIISFVGRPNCAMEFFRKIGERKNQVHEAMIIGGSKIGFYLSKLLVSSGIGVKLIDKDRDQCERLNESIPDAMIIHGNGNDHDMLLEEGLTDVDAFIALTNHDEENMFLSLYAQSQSDAKLVTKVQKLNYDAMIERLDLGSMIYPEYLTAQYIIQYVRARQNSIGSNIENLYKLMDGRAEALEFHIQKGSPVIGRPIKDLSLIDNLLICSIYRKGKPMIPNGQDHMEEDDLVVVVTTKKGLHDVKDILKRG